MQNDDEWEEVGSFGASWEPKSTGSKEKGNLTLKQPSDKSWLRGYYLGCKENVGKNKTTVHTLKLVSVGDPADITGEESQNVSFWGNGVIDKKIAEGVAPGMLIQVKWLGLKKSLKAGGNDYHDWELKVNKKAEPLGGASLPPDLAKTIAPEAPVSTTTPVSPGSIMDTDEDLPF